MLGTIRKSAAIALVAALPATALLTGCQGIERETGIGQETQLGAGAGAAAGGIIAAIADANPGWIAASTVLGGLAGGAITEYMNREDAERHGATQYTALENLEEGETRRWDNPDTGNRGSTTVNDVYTRADGTTCKEFTETVVADGRTVTETATACRARDGEWQVVQT